MNLYDFIKKGEPKKEGKIISDDTKFVKHRLEDFKRPEFTEIKDKFKVKESKCDKNENWFYIEYYKQNEKWKELINMVGKHNFIGQSKHELNHEWFFNLIKKASKEEWFKKLGNTLQVFMEE